MRNLCSQHAIDHCYQVSRKSVQWFQRRRFLKKLTDDGRRRRRRRTQSDANSSHGLWPGELKSVVFPIMVFQKNWVGRSEIFFIFHFFFILTSFSIFGNDPEILRAPSDLESEVSFTNQKWRTRDVLKLSLEFLRF